jgi:hypothetical protein
MMTGRARECLKVLRWSAADLADQLGQPVSDVDAWLEGRAPVPIMVIAWLEALAKAHRSLPAPNLDQISASKKPALVRDAQIVLPQHLRDIPPRVMRSSVRDVRSLRVPSPRHRSHHASLP